MKHHHKLQRIKFKPSGKIIYKCQLPGCTTYFLEQLAWNQITLCWSCLDPFVLLKRKNNQVRPKCSSCNEPKDEKLNDLLGSLPH